MSDGKKETISITTFKKWPFANDFRIETEGGKVLSALWKYRSEVEYNDFPARGKFCKNSVNEGILLVGNDIKKLAQCGFGLKNLVIEVLHRLPRHLCSNFSCLFTQQYAMLLYENVSMNDNTAD